MVSNCTRPDCNCETNNLLLQIRDFKCLEPLNLAVSKTSKGVSGREVPLHQVINVLNFILYINLVADIAEGKEAEGV